MYYTFPIPKGEQAYKSIHILDQILIQYQRSTYPMELHICIDGANKSNSTWLQIPERWLQDRDTIYPVVNTECLSIYSVVHSSHKLFPQVTTHMSEHEVCLSRPALLLKSGWELYQQMKGRAQIPGCVQTCHFDNCYIKVSQRSIQSV